MEINVTAGWRDLNEVVKIRRRGPRYLFLLSSYSVKKNYSHEILKYRSELSGVAEEILCFEARWKSKVIALAIFEKKIETGNVYEKKENSMAWNDKIIFVAVRENKNRR